jgi:hypothetical protein
MWDNGCVKRTAKVIIHDPRAMIVSTQYMNMLLRLFRRIMDGNEVEDTEPF